jgi:ATP-dependent RNA helicase DeaD
LTNTPDSSTPADIAEPEIALPSVELADLSEAIQGAVSQAKWTELSPVQSKAIPYLVEGRDLMVQARTGSGKTGAFLLPMLDVLDGKLKKPQALILVPTRELAKQVAEDAATLFKGSGLESVAVYGGVGYGPQIDGFKRGVQLVVGTPGRVLDHLLKRNLKLDDLKMLVFDEADRMLSMGFYPDMLDVKSYLPKNVNGTMFSATFPPNVQRLASRFLNNADFLSLSRDHVHVTDVSHIAMEVPRMDKDRALVRIIEVENPDQALIFCNTKAKVNYVNTVLQRFGYNSDELSSDLSQNAREKVLGKLRDKQLRFLVATDVAARGLDIPELSHVIIYEAPDDTEDYIHRAGRTGRAGAGGVAITLVTNLEKRGLIGIAARYKIEFLERSAPTDEDVSNIVSQRLTALLEAQLRGRDKLKSERMQRFQPLVEELAAGEQGRKLLSMLLDDNYHLAVHKQSPNSEIPKREKRPSRPRKNQGRPRNQRSKRGKR